MTAAKEPSVAGTTPTDIVAWLERRINDGMNPVYLHPDFARALISDWRKRGEERDSARALLRDIARLSNINEALHASISKELGPTREDEPRSPRAS